MCTDRLALVFRSVAIILFSLAVASCGSGSGKPTVNSADGAAVAGSQSLRLVFEDDFGGSIGAARLAGKTALPASNWRVETGYGDNGWGNDEWQNYTKSTDNLYIENGALVISAQCSTGGSCSDAGVNKRTGAITSARINTKNKLHVRYGSVSARIKMPSGIGTWPAFWMLGADIDDLRWPDAGEIDIVEMHYKFSNNKTTHFTTHWSAPIYAEGTNPTCSGRIPGVNTGEEQHCFTATKTFDTPLTDDFHVFELVWDENSITGKIDDVTYYTLGIDPETMEEFLKDYFMILNVAVGGTLGGTPDASMDWTNPDQTNMLVDWVRVYERVQPDTATLIDESGNNLPYNRIINSAEFGAAFVDSDLKSKAVAPLVGDQVLELNYATSLSPDGGATQGYSAAFFSFNRIDLSEFNNIIFSMDVSQFENFDDVAVEFEDFNSGKATVRTSDLTPIATVGNWNTYKVPFSDYAGVAMDDIKFLAIISPNDVNNNLIGGKLYLDDIRFSQEECTAEGAITFDSANYNPDTRVAAVNIDDICAAGSLASIDVDNGSEQVTLGVKLDAAGRGQVIFGLVNGLSICPADDQASVLPLAGALTATYTKTVFDEAAAPSLVIATATAGFDTLAPGTLLVGDEKFLYSTSQALNFLPDNDFAYSVFGSESLLNGAAADATFNPSFGVTSGTGYGGGIHVGQIIWLGGDAYPAFAGFAEDLDSITFKVKDLPGNKVIVELGLAGANVDAVTINDVTSSPYSTPIGVTGWYQIEIPSTKFPASNSADFLAITGGNGGTSEFTYLITDVSVRIKLFNVDATCEELVPDPGSSSSSSSGGSSSGGGIVGSIVPEVVLFSSAGTGEDLVFGTDYTGYTPFGSGSSFEAAVTTDTTFDTVFAVTTGSGYGAPVGQFGFEGFSAGFADGVYDELVFKIKGADSDFIRVKFQDPGSNPFVDVTLTSTSSEYTSTDIGDGWYQVVIPIDSSFGDISTATIFLFESNGLSANYTFYLTDIGFNNAAGGSSSGGSGGGGSGQQLSINGDIETSNGDLSGWTQTPNAGSITAVNDQGSGGTWAVNVSAVPANASALSLDGLGVGIVQPGDTLDVSFDMCAVAADGGEIAVALLSEKGPGNGADRVELVRTATPADVWTRYNYSTTAGTSVPGGVSLQFDVICGGASSCVANAYFDNVSITLGGGPVAGSATGASCAAPVAPPATLPIDFEAGPYVFGDFNGGQASVEANSQSSGINTSANVGKMIKFVGDSFAGSTLDLGGTLTVPANSSSITMKVWSPRAIPVLFKLEGGTPFEATANHSGGSVWEELTFDFSAFATGEQTAITLFFDPGAIGNAAVAPGDWTFYFDDIDFVPAPPAPNVTLFADAFAPGWVGFLDANGTVTQVTDSNSTYGEVLEITTGGSTVVGLGTRGLGDGSTIDTSRFGVLEFDLKLVTVPTSGTTNWRLKVENAAQEIGIDTPVLDTWVRYSIPMSSLGTPNALDLIMLFPDYGANAGAVYRLDNVKLLEVASPPPPVDITLFADALAAGWVGFLDANGTVTQVTDSDPTYGEVLEITTGGGTVVGIGSRAAIGGSGVNIDTNGYATVEFDLKLVTAPTSGTTTWRLKFENPGQEIGIDAPVLDTWVNYSIPISSLGTPDALDLIMLFPDYGANAGAVYRLDNVKLLVDSGGGGGGPASGELTTNGGFETGDFTGTEQFVNSGTQSISAVNPKTGTFSANLFVANSVSDTVLKFPNLAPGGFTAGQTVTVSFDMRGTLSGGGVGFAEFFSEITGGGTSKADILFGGGPIFPNADPNVWTNFSTTVTTGADTSGGVTLQLKVASGGSTNAELFFDNVSVSVP